MREKAATIAEPHGDEKPGAGASFVETGLNSIFFPVSAGQFDSANERWGAAVMSVS